MTQLTTTPEGFRTAAYLAARARLDAARSRSGKTSRSVDCNPPNVRCGGRCIPPSWDCRLKGEGPDPHLRAVKTDPLSGFANIQRGIGRITKGVTRGNFSEVEGGKRAIIRGVVKTVPGDIQQKKQLQKTLENRTRAIGIGLAVVTGGLGMHAILMKSNLYGYNKGWGQNINQATRAGVSRVLDSIPVLGTQRRATQAGVKAGVAAATARASAPAMSNSAIPGTTVLSATNRESHSALQQSLNKINGAARSGVAGTSGNLENWNQRHKEAFWSADRSHDLSLKDAKGKSIDRISIYAEPTAQEYLGNQFGVPAGERTSRSSIKAAMQARLSEERSGLVSLAKQQGFRTIRTRNGDRIHEDDVNLFVRGVMRNNPIADTAVRQRVEAHVSAVLKDAPSTYTDKLYNASVVSFDTFYKETSAGLANIPGAAATGRRVATPLTAGSNELLRNTNTYRSTYLAGEMRVRTQMGGPAHAELVQTAYYHTKVMGGLRGPGGSASQYTITDRLALNAASELSGRSITSRTEAIGIINRETGFSGARVATTAAPRTAASSTTGQARPATRQLRSRSQLISTLTKGGLSPEAAAAEADRIIARRGDEDDLPPRVAAYLQMRNDFVAGKKGQGKPCGESHIPKTHECTKGRGAQAAPASSESKSNTKTIAAAALIGTAAVATGLYVVHDLKRVEKQTNMFKASPSIKTTIKKAKVDFDTKKSGTAMGNYYTQKSGLKPGDVVYYRTEKDPAAHFGVYLGEGADGKVRAVMANTNEKRAGFIDIFEVGTTKPNSNDAAHFMLPVLQKAPTLSGNARLSNEETVRRALRSVGSDYKFSLTRDNCEVLANSIAYGTPRSQQLERFTRVTRAVADSTIGVQQRTVGTIRRARGQTVTKALTAKQIMARLERDDSTFLTTEGKTVAGAHYKQFFADGTRFDARYDALGELLTPAQVWSKIKDYDDLQKAIAMRDYLLLVRLASETEQARTDAKGKGKPCGESFIPRTHECRVRAGQTIAKVALAAGVVGGAAFALRKAKLGEFHTGLMTGNVGGVRKRRMSFMEKNQTALNSEQLAKTFTDLKKQKGVIPENVDALQSFIRKDNVVNDPANFYKDLEAGLNQAKAINKPQQEATLRQVKLLNTLGGFDGLASQYSNNVYVRSIRKNAATLSADPQEVTNTVGKFMDLRSGTPNNTILPTDPNFKKLFTVASSTKNGDAAEYINTIHEIAHKVHFRASVKTGSTPDTIGLGIVYNPLENPKFMQTRDKAGMNAQLRRSSSGYGLSDYEGRKAETFAELSVLYVTQGKRFKQDNPLAYDWVDDIWKTANG